MVFRNVAKDKAITVKGNARIMITALLLRFHESVTTQNHDGLLEADYL
jgi:hypothetical protein